MRSMKFAVQGDLYGICNDTNADYCPLVAIDDPVRRAGEADVAR